MLKYFFILDNKKKRPMKKPPNKKQRGETCSAADFESPSTSTVGRGGQKKKFVKQSLKKTSTRATPATPSPTSTFDPSAPKPIPNKQGFYSKADLDHNVRLGIPLEMQLARAEAKSAELVI